jgi:3'-5' exoribonuclease
MSDETQLLPIDQMPTIYRVVSVNSRPMQHGRGVEYRIGLFHEQMSLQVSFTRSQPQTNLQVDGLVSIWWKLPVTTVKGDIQITRLSVIEKPIKGMCLFDTIPYEWVKNRELIPRAKSILAILPDNLQYLITAILWNGPRFKRFCCLPSSVNNHQAYKNGNLHHTLEVAEFVRLNSNAYPQANIGVCLAAAWLHDAGKADEYVAWSYGWGMTDRGKLIGHRHTILEWISVAMATNRIMIPESHYLSLLHAMTAAPSAEFIGIRPPTTPEATLLNLADKLSVESSMAARLANDKGGWGDAHPHRKARLYTLPQLNKPK